MNVTEKITVLYIDDEPNNLQSFQATFRRKYHILTASSAAEGMGVLNEHPEVHVVIADQRMPYSTGVEFFNIVRKSHPEPIRILLTGYTDVEAIVDAINKGEIYRYIKKPWDEVELQNAIQNGYDMYITRGQLHQKIDELEKKNSELNRFVYSISHDLRSPLASIMGILSLAKMEDSVKDPNNYMGMIGTCADRMDLFIQKIIEYYKGLRADDEIVPIDFTSLLNESIEMCRMQNPAIQFELSVSQEDEFYNDAFRLSIIMNNLISNAVKYQKTTEVQPRVKVSVHTTAEMAKVSIEDNGIGILDQHLNSIFKMFFRSSSNTSISGVGIGLFIVKEALQHIGGDISVHSVFGVGTTFTLTLPNKSPVVYAR
ncbi:hybrid sensor histidine kinase/response regulator [Deminuibacter soli]|uniref:histidine kinase n=1 Tax=Deminuibacter soli TaxID=2291815 RepID=A0A3E1ND24_9BACT|nr:hybrid sensor histidine kinase/response regulator [Deminuibacter soli]RFM25840.1 hybrid sensor histidine kinase/response regulator [Deminuibacter soli]